MIAQHAGVSLARWRAGGGGNSGGGEAPEGPGLGCWVEGSELDPGDPAGEECVRRIRRWNQILVCRKHGRLEHRGWSRAEQERS